MRYFVYARKSSESEERQARSITNQHDTCWEISEKQGLNVVAEFTEARSASSPGRPVFGEMLERIESGEANAILAWEPNRLARNSIDGGRILHLLDTGVLSASQVQRMLKDPFYYGFFDYGGECYQG
ncbi:recombinase family protein [bacterium]|nr:recombinase family protein [bacterium]